MVGTCVTAIYYVFIMILIQLVSYPCPISGLNSVSETNSISNAMTTSTKTAGTLIWSMRSQSVNGGAIIHSEGNNAYAYHWPGYSGGKISVLSLLAQCSLPYFQLTHLDLPL